MNILEQIVAQKKIEVEQAKQRVSVRSLELSNFFLRSTASLSSNLQQQSSSGIIAEFKRKSPSKGIINDTANVLDVVKAYENAGVSACSILTDELFFGGNKQDIIIVRDELNVPVLRKDFMIDEYQFVEAKSLGADVVLLIASILTPKQVKDFTALARSLQLEVLLELHDESELHHVCNDVHMVGINNRNLKTFEVDVEQSIRMADKLGNDFVKVAESGISSVEMLKHFKNNGFQGFLIGENFMKTQDPGLSCKQFIEQLN